MVTVTHSYPLTLPSYPRPSAHTFRPRRVVAGVRSPFTLKEQVQEYPGFAWELKLEYPPMSKSEAALWIAFFLKLHGRYGYFRAGDPDYAAPLGSIAAALTVSGAGQSGNRLQCAYAGAVMSTGLLLPGDPFQIGDYLYRAVEQADADSAGQVTLTFEPSLRSTPSNGAEITYTNPTSLFRLDDNPEWSSDALMIYGLSISATEVPPSA